MIPNTLSLALVIYSDRLLFILLLMLSFYSYCCLPLAHLPLIYPSSIVFNQSMSFIVAKIFQLSFFFFLAPASLGHEYMIVFVFMKYNLFFSISTLPGPQFDILIPCSLFRFVCSINMVYINNI